MRRRDSDIRHRVAAVVLAAGMLAGSAVAGPAAVYAAGAESPKGAEAQAGMTEEAMSETSRVATSEEEHGIPADEWLPIGSVVKVRGYKRSFMVLGRAVLNDSDSRYYDYCACIYPDGHMGGTLYFFNQDLIARVESEGYEDAYEKLYREENLDGLDVEALTDGSQTEAAKGEGSESGAAAGAQETEESTEADQAGQTEPAESETAGTAYTTTTNVRLRSEPSTDGEALTTIPGGRQVTEDTSRKEKDSWIPVLFTDNTGKILSGWIKKTYLK